MFINLIILSLLGSLVNTVPLGQINSISICNSSAFKYYQEHPSNPRKYFQCDPWGDSTERECSNETVWNNWLVKCDQAHNLKNLTLNLVLEVENFDCTLEKNECINQGVCNNERKCECLPQFTGEKCESQLQSMVEDILNQNFNLTNFKLQLSEAKNFVNATYYEKYRQQLDNSTYSKLNDYLDMFKDGIRFDNLVNSLVEKILKEIYPDTEFLAFFYPYEQPIGSLLRLMPSMLSYSRYSADRYVHVLDHFKDVLTQLIDSLKLHESNLTQKAVAYKNLTLFLLKKTILMSNGTNSLANRTVESMRLEDGALKEYLRFNFDIIADSSEHLFGMLEQFHVSLISQFGFGNFSIYDINLKNVGFDQVDQVFDMYTDIKAASGRVWNALNNFGFWFITNFLSSL
ncbi:hypothetical protein BpHYR1_051051 [Brachionus plicatilis]|uniref:EGF-like domain-containing protein n=1 Tax=Brachionus plicatilis TaxID=10195 RepID=A0A3M7PRX3_BRAPC|nr:hypothetical protein BpHYR1_051051 [Brachionus plicatilis]